MSHVEVAKLKGINDETIKWDTIVFPFLLLQERHDFLTENNSYVRSYRVVNRDTTNILTYRQDQANKQLITLDPSTQENQEGWTSYLEVNPNAVTGSGFLEVDLVTRENAQIKLERGQIGR